MLTENKQKAGVFIDIDGVVLKGGKPYEWSKDAIHRLWDNDVPFVFVTNGTYSSKNLIDNLSNILELPFTNDHVMVAPSPCHDLVEYHDKRVLVCCQNDSVGLITELGFTNALTISELSEIFPELDYVDHEKRKRLLESVPTSEMLEKRRNFQPIEAILLLGEPINWECSLQILLDVLMTSGDPRSQFKFVPKPHLPLIACNKDLTFKGAASLPRFGHGAFLNCLESIYLKVTNNVLEYKNLMGKPYMVTYEYAQNHIQKQSKNGQTINKFFIIGDNPEVDIRGANLYKDYFANKSKCQKQLIIEKNIPPLLNSNFKVRKPVESILVCTGVYNPQNDLKSPCINYFDNPLDIPDVTVNNLMDSVDYILKNV